MKPKAKILDYLEIVAPILPAPIYWFDIDSNMLGINEPSREAIGGKTSRDIIGKSVYELGYPFEMADSIVKHNERVIRTGEILSQEDVIKNMSTGEIRCFTAIRAPLKDENGDVIGVVGTSVEITEEKEIERLKNAQLQEYQKFKNLADQMAHDLGSPLMALSVLENHCAELPEAKRNMLRESISSIREIAGSLLSQYKPIEDQVEISNSDKVLLYAVVEQVILEKQHEYHNLPIKFISEYEEDARFSFIRGNITAFKRMLSNLINNSVQAIEDKSGSVSIKLGRENQNIKISIKDNGKGIPHNILNKILNNIPVTLGKDKGHGIGFSQIHETLSQINGKLNIESEVHEGTTVTLTLTQIPVPDWVAETITINSDDVIIVLDDDNSIHGAWDVRFGELLQTNPDIKVIHYTKAVETIDYINKLSEAEKQRIFLLTDYELLKQNQNGLDIIAKTQVKRSILVTSHYNNPKIRQQASNTNTKVLPKILASFIPIKVAVNILI